MLVKITTGDWTGNYEAASGLHAMQTFFDDVRAGNINLHMLGVLGHWTNGSEVYPFRIAPALYRAGVITLDALEQWLEAAGLDLTDAELNKVIEEDEWMVRLGPMPGPPEGGDSHAG